MNNNNNMRRPITSLLLLVTSSMITIHIISIDATPIGINSSRLPKDTWRRDEGTEREVLENRTPSASVSTPARNETTRYFGPFPTLGYESGPPSTNPTPPPPPPHIPLYLPPLPAPTPNSPPTPISPPVSAPSPVNSILDILGSLFL